MFLYLQLYKEIEICTKDTKVIRFDKAESCTTGYGNLELSTVMFMSIHFVWLVCLLTCQSHHFSPHWVFKWNHLLCYINLH